MANKRVLSVGQCGFDQGNLARALRQRFHAEVTAAHTTDEALAELKNGAYDVVLVNRVFDGDGSSGLDFIRALKADERLRAVPVLLVSNFEDAQREAVAAGAAPGFGKAALGRLEMGERLKAYLED